MPAHVLDQQRADAPGRLVGAEMADTIEHFEAIIGANMRRGSLRGRPADRDVVVAPDVTGRDGDRRQRDAQPGGAIPGKRGLHRRGIADDREIIVDPFRPEARAGEGLAQAGGTICEQRGGGRGSRKAR